MSVRPNDKKFDKKSFKENDPKAKKVVMEWLAQFGFIDIEENVNEAKRIFDNIWDVRGQHFLAGEWRVEGEIKKDWGVKWTDRPFKYETVDIPYRKRNKTEVHATHHMVIGGDLKRLFLVKREVVLASSVGYKKCRNRNEPEPFFNVKINSPDSSFWFKEGKKWVKYEEK